MPPLDGPSDVSPDMLGSTSALAARAPVGSVFRSSQSRLAVLTVPAVCMVAFASQAHAQAAAVGDRYSGEVYVQPAYRQAGPASGPTLSWPGKTAAAAPEPAPPSPSSGYGQQMRAPAYAYAPQAYRSAAPVAYQAPTPQQVAQDPAYPSPTYQAPSSQAPAYQPPPYQAQVARASAPQVRAYGAPPVMPWYQRYGATEGSSAPASAAPPPPAPQSIYDPPPAKGAGANASSAASPPAAVMAPPAAPTAAAANDGETARFYSLHRQYGLTPDPDPIPPQFFTQTADLSDPPGPSPVYKAATSSGGSTTAVHPVQADDSTSTLGQL